ncbi:MAG: DUF2779 domain-containing protein [Anaerolineaceae bacterium]|nr:DUF2779 domain-containing protein [Anaerolineaceae bacterium]
MNANLNLTKSDFLLFLDAPLHLWAKKHDHIDQPPSDFDINMMKQGYEVEALAKMFAENTLMNQDDNQPLIFQRIFTDGQYTAKTDILIHKPETNSFDLYEVKSGTSVKPENIYDAAFQFLIIQQQIDIEHVFILHLNSKYIRGAEFELEQLFVVEDISVKVEQLLDEVKISRKIALNIAALLSHENISPCYDPKNCPYPSICHPDLPEVSIYDIPRLSKNKKSELLSMGIVGIEEVPESYSLSDKQRKIVDVLQSNEEYVNKKAIKGEFGKFIYPLYFLDYETYLSAIPLFEGYKPQQQMVFQYSLHKMEALEGEIKHTDHLAITKADPSQSLVKQLSKDIGAAGTVFVWNKAFEMTRNKEMAIIYPEHADFLSHMNERIYDLGEFISNGYYLHPGFKGSWSIKNVLPVMIPELSYHGMEIGKGDQAMMAWWNLVTDKIPIDEIDQTKRSLLKYCEMDTLAMVRIFLALAEKGN